jgi:hypothetical protein
MKKLFAICVMASMFLLPSVCNAQQTWILWSRQVQFIGNSCYSGEASDIGEWEPQKETQTLASCLNNKDKIIESWKNQKQVTSSYLNYFCLTAPYSARNYNISTAVEFKCLPYPMAPNGGK